MERRSKPDLDRAQAVRTTQSDLRKELASKVNRLELEIERLFTRSVELRYSAIRQRRRAAVAALLLPAPGLNQGRRRP